MVKSDVWKILLNAGMDGTRGRGRQRRCYLDAVKYDLNMREFEWSMLTQDLALDWLKWRRIVEEMRNMQVQPLVVFKCVFALVLLLVTIMMFYESTLIPESWTIESDRKIVEFWKQEFWFCVKYFIWIFWWSGKTLVNQCTSSDAIQNWVTEFKRGTSDIRDEHRFRRSVAVSNPEDIDSVHDSYKHADLAHSYSREC